MGDQISQKERQNMGVTVEGKRWKKIDMGLFTGATEKQG